MEARGLIGSPHRIFSPWTLPAAVGSVRSVWRCAGLEAKSNGSCSSGSTSSNKSWLNSFPIRQQRISQIAHVAQWSSTHSDPQPALPGKRLPIKPGADAAVPEAHKVFDEVVIVVKSGRGGNGEVIPAGRGRYVPNHKYKPGANQPKQIWLPASDPGDGADGGDVVLVCDPGVDSLLHLHQQKNQKQNQQRQGGGKAGGIGGGGAVAGTFCAPDGANANPNTGSGGPKRNREIKKALTPALEIPVPPGTVVKRRGTGALLGELLQPGQRLTVVRGGQGGHGVVAPSREQRRARISRAERDARSKGIEVVEVEDEGWLSDSRGHPGLQLTLTLSLRVVADVGLVGFPNAGKSSLLKALTRASPTIAPYPFTTLMPNLGVLSAGGGATRAVLADLPGLIEGAHKGRGLGRNFLRHLRRTRALLHVVDASGPDPATDYYAVREELRMYNPEYCARPHVVALNKMDLLQPVLQSLDQQQQAQGQEEDEDAAVTQMLAAIRDAARRQAAEHAVGSYDGPAPRVPLVIVPCSAATGEGLKELAAALQRAIGVSKVSEADIVRPAPDTLAAARSMVPLAHAAAPDEASGTVATVATVSAAAAAAAAATTMASPQSVPRGLPPPPPPGWYDNDDDSAGDDAATELEEGELERFAAQCRELGLMDERGNFKTHKPSSSSSWKAAAGAEDEDGGLEARFSERMNHDVLDEQEESFWDEHAPAGAAPGDGAADDDEWVELSSLDEQTLAAVLDELECSSAGGGGGGEDDELLLDLRRDFRMAGPLSPSPSSPPLTTTTTSTSTTTATSTGGQLPTETSRQDHHSHQQQPIRRQEQRNEETQQQETLLLQQQQYNQLEQVKGVEWGEAAVEDEEEGEELVRMAPLHDPDAGLLKLSLEELLALERDW